MPGGGKSLPPDHGADFHRIVDHTRAVTNPAKALAMTVVDLLSDDAREARRVTAEFKPRMSQAAYLDYLRRLSTRELFRAEDLEH